MINCKGHFTMCAYAPRYINSCITRFANSSLFRKCSTMDVSVHDHVVSMRKKYSNEDSNILDIEISKDPIKLFGLWFEDAIKSVAESPMLEPNAMALSTADAKGRPSCRMVLMRGFSADGFRFFTNYRSRKAQDIDENPNVSLMLYWPTLSRSVRIEGLASKISTKQSEDYFRTRPKNSQISTHVSQNQSAYVDSYNHIVEKAENLKKEFETCDVPCPDFWGGYIVKPNRMEFWRGHSDRLHNRLCFYKSDCDRFNPNEVEIAENGWVYQNLQP